MRLTVHIGMPKTGSTSIQNWLNENRRALAKQGVGYSRICVKGTSERHSQLEYAVCQYDRFGKIFPNEQVRDALNFSDMDGQRQFAIEFKSLFENWLQKAKPEHLVISSEHIGSATQNAALATALDEWFAEWFQDRRYIVYFRRQEDWLLSNYSQTLRSGSSKTLDEYLNMDRLLNYFRTAKIWTQAVGRNNFTVRLLEREALKDGDLITDFSEFIGVDETQMRRPEKLNEAFGAAAAEYIRQFNASVATEGIAKNAAKLRHLRSEINTIAAPDKSLRLSREQRDRIRKRHAKSNEKLRASFFPERDVLFPPLQSYPPAQPQCLLPEKKEEISRELEKARNKRPILGVLKRITTRISNR